MKAVACTMWPEYYVCIQNASVPGIHFVPGLALAAEPGLVRLRENGKAPGRGRELAHPTVYCDALFVALLLLDFALGG